MTGAELERRTTKWLTIGIVLSNVGGASVVFVFLVYLLPAATVATAHGQRVLNTYVFVAFMLVSVPVGRLWGTRVAQPLAEWLRSERPPTPDQRRAVLRQPLRQMRVNASIWAAAALVFGALNVGYDAAATVDIIVTVALGGFATCTISYLLSERILRPAVSRAMLDTGEPPPVLLGVKPRLLLAWGIGSAIPLVGIAMGLISPASHDGLSRAGVLFLVAVGLVVGFGSITAAAGAVSDPVQSVAAGLRSVGHGRLDVTVPVYDASEVGQLQSGFNAMVSGLRERDRLRDLFGRQVGDDVAALAVERGVELGGETRHVAVLFVDVVGSTALAESLDQQEVVRRLNAFFGVVIEVVQDQGGWVNKFEGDAVLCVFGAPVAVDDATTSALRAARELAVRLRPLDVDAAVGVAAGPVVAGHVGTESRFEYTVIGDPVNAAARLTDLAKNSDGCVLADALLLETASPDEAARWQVGDEVVLRGRRTPTRLASPR